MASAPLLLVVTVLAAWNTPGYSGWRDTVSRLGSAGQPWSPAVRTAFVMYGVLVGVGVRAVVQGRPGARVAAVGLYLFALAAVTAGLAPKDLRGAPHTTTSDIHVYATVSGGAALLVAMAAIGISEPGPRKIVTAGAAIVAVVATIVFRFTWGSPYYGAIERVVLVPGMAWLVLTAVWSWPKRDRSADRSPPRAAACGGHRTRP